MARESRPRPGVMILQLTQHARDVLAEREIAMAWVERVLAAPEHVEPDPNDAECQRYFGRVPECDNRWHRVVVATDPAGPRLVTVFLDRKRRRLSGSQRMRVRFDAEADALYIRLAETKIEESEEVRPGIVLDYDAGGRVVGIEVLGVGERLPEARPGLTEVEITTSAAE